MIEHSEVLELGLAVQSNSPLIQDPSGFRQAEYYTDDIVRDSSQMRVRIEGDERENKEEQNLLAPTYKTYLHTVIV